MLCSVGHTPWDLGLSAPALPTPFPSSCAQPHPVLRLMSSAVPRPPQLSLKILLLSLTQVESAVL